ncbi:carbohydrate porin, partial [bacterium]|nr:carbohydrate porin [bacterium]
SNRLGVFDLIFSMDFEKLFQWKNASFYSDFIGIQGKDPSEYTGDLQGISNIAAENTWKLYEAWLQQKFRAGRISVLMGIYDLNSEFDVTETAGLFINGSHGMGPDFSQSGKNGTPTFPYSDLAVRLKVEVKEDFYWQSVIMDGVPGNPERSQAIDFRIHKKNGALLVSEFSYLKGDEKIVSSTYPCKRKQRRGRRLGYKKPRCPKRGLKRGRNSAAIEIPDDRYLKIALGGWYYSAEFDDLYNDYSSENPVLHKGNWGVYALGEKILYSQKNNPAGGLSAFFRVGLADKRINRIDKYIGTGVVFSGISRKRFTGQTGIAIAAAHNSEIYKKAMLQQNKKIDNWEVNLEFSNRIMINKWLYFQPDIQYILNPGSDLANNNALTVGMRIELSF